MPRLGFGLVVLLVSLVFAPHARASLYANPAPIEVPGCAMMDCTTLGAGNPYPSTITVDGLPPVAKIRVTMRGITHTAPDDIDALLVGPTGVRTLLMRATCAGSPLNAVSLMFEDGGSHTSLPATGPCAPGVYNPTNYDGSAALSPPAPAPPYVGALGRFAGGLSSGVWKLFVEDAGGPGGVGSVAGGWRLEVLPQVSCAGKSPSDYANAGTAGNDVITGTPGPDVLLGLGGNDTIDGTAGKDVICGGDGDDTLLGGPGKDKLRGEAGRDKLKGQGGKDTCVGGAQRDKAKGCEKAKSI